MKTVQASSIAWTKSLCSPKHYGGVRGVGRISDREDLLDDLGILLVEVKEGQDELNRVLEARLGVEGLALLLDDVATEVGQELLESVGGAVKTVGDTRQESEEATHVVSLVILKPVLEVVLESLVVALNKGVLNGLDKGLFASRVQVGSSEGLLQGVRRGWA